MAKVCQGQGIKGAITNVNCHRITDALGHEGWSQTCNLDPVVKTFCFQQHVCKSNQNSRIWILFWIWVLYMWTHFERSPKSWPGKKRTTLPPSSSDIFFLASICTPKRNKSPKENTLTKASHLPFLGGSSLTVGQQKSEGNKNNGATKLPNWARMLPVLPTIKPGRPSPRTRASPWVGTRASARGARTGGIKTRHGDVQMFC